METPTEVRARASSSHLGILNSVVNQLCPSYFQSFSILPNNYAHIRKACMYFYPSPGVWHTTSGPRDPPVPRARCYGHCPGHPQASDRPLGGGLTGSEGELLPVCPPLPHAPLQVFSAAGVRGHRVSGPLGKAVSAWRGLGGSSGCGRGRPDACCSVGLVGHWWGWWA